jgi:proline iminopeptidase
MPTLYPDIEPYTTHQLAVGQGHVLMVEECGNPKGIPVVFLHGGPGAHCKPYQRSFFDPKRYRIVLFDQRGAGRSTPTGSLQHNTTWDLLADMETIRKQLSIEKWLISGGSWGTTLGLLYAQQYPHRVLGLILRSTFLARKRDIDWCCTDGKVNQLFPAQWQTFVQLLPQAEAEENLLTIYYEQLTSQDTTIVERAVLAWATWGGCVVSSGEFSVPTEASKTLINEVRIECHYMVNQFFLAENQLLRDLPKITHLPAIIVHGQRDLICPLENSYLLAQNWPTAQLKIVPNAGHLAHDPGMISTLVEATDKMATQIGKF